MFTPNNAQSILQIDTVDSCQKFKSVWCHNQAKHRETKAVLSEGLIKKREKIEIARATHSHRLR